MYNVTGANHCLNTQFYDICIAHSMHGANDVPKHSVTSIHWYLHCSIIKNDIDSLLTDEDLEMIVAIYNYGVEKLEGLLYR